MAERKKATFQRLHDGRLNRKQPTWWSSAVNRVRLSLRVTSRTPSKPPNSPIRLCARGAVVCPMFSLVDHLAERRQHSGRDYFAAHYPACMCGVVEIAPGDGYNADGSVRDAF